MNWEEEVRQLRHELEFLEREGNADQKIQRIRKDLDKYGVQA